MHLHLTMTQLDVYTCQRIIKLYIQLTGRRSHLFDVAYILRIDYLLDCDISALVYTSQGTKIE